jgi:molybdopterin molybdotransferase
MQGADPTLRLEPAVLETAVRANGAREHWMRGRLGVRADGRLSATPLADQDSSLVRIFAEADALIRHPAGAPALGPGDLVETLRLARL